MSHLDSPGVKCCAKVEREEDESRKMESTEMKKQIKKERGPTPLPFAMKRHYEKATEFDTRS